MQVRLHILKLKKVQTVDQVTAPLTQTFLLQLGPQIIQHLPKLHQAVPQGVHIHVSFVPLWFPEVSPPGLEILEVRHPVQV